MTPEGEVIFSARYSAFRVWFMVIVVLLFPVLIGFLACYGVVLKGRYLHAAVFSIIPLSMLLVTLDSILFKELLFYQDRVVKVWHFFGHRTIHYSAGKVVDTPRYLRRILSGHHIRETKPGKVFVIQVPILYIGFLFPSATARKIEAIMDYLTQDLENNPRAFKQARLPKEGICQKSPCCR